LDVGWDVVVTDDEDGFALIEGNAFCDVDLVQVHESPLSDDRVRPRRVSRRRLIQSRASPSNTVVSLAV
jgi:hypothetical protein